MRLTLTRCIHGVNLLERHCWCTMRSGNSGLINGQAIEFGRKVGTEQVKVLDHTDPDKLKYKLVTRDLIDYTKIKHFTPHKRLPLRGEAWI